MITKQDCLSILIQLEDNGVKNIDPIIKKLLTSSTIPVEVLKFISQNRGLESENFYMMLRKSYNQKRSPLYKNILKERTLEDFPDIITTLSCLLVQIVLYGNKLKDKETFFKEMRTEELTRVLNNYFKTGVYEDCVKLLKLIKSDLLVLEYINGRRQSIS